MGGTGSGRHWHWNAKDLTSQYRRIDVRRWAREGLLEPGRQFGSSWSIGGEPAGSIQVRAEYGRVRLMYKCRSHSDEWEDLDYTVNLTSTPCHLGGYRKWFECPARGCGRRVAILYGGRIFACRHCHQLAYPSQRECSFQRSQHRADRILEKLGWSDDPDLMYGIKPKGMHWRTYHRLVRELDLWQDQANDDFAVYFVERFGRL